jgi:4-hydroxybenzoate polyprenyltransferase
MRATWRSLTDFLLFTSIYIAGCALAMALHATYFYGLTPNRDLLLFIISGTLCSYNFHWMLTPSLYGESRKAAWSYAHRRLHAFLFAASGIGAAWWAFRLIDQWYWLLLTAFITFLYSAPKVPGPLFRHLKRVAVGKTAFLALAWTHIPYILPLLLSGRSWRAADYLIIFNRFYLIYAICILFDYRDREADRAEGIRSLVTALPEPGIRRLYAGSLVAFFISGLLLPLFEVSLLETALLLLPGLLLCFCYRYSLRDRSDYFYYFALDGLMALSAVLSLMARFT